MTSANERGISTRLLTIAAAFLLVCFGFMVSSSTVSVSTTPQSVSTASETLSNATLVESPEQVSSPAIAEKEPSTQGPRTTTNEPVTETPKSDTAIGEQINVTQQPRENLRIDGNLPHWSPRWTVESGVTTIFTLPTQAKDSSTFTQEVLKPVRISADELKETLFPIQNSSAKPFEVSRVNVSSLTVLPRPSQEEEAVGMCFYGLFRFIGTVERMWQRTKPNLDGIPKRNIFISTWDYIQTGKSVDKSQRRKARAWFQHGHPVDDMPKRLEAIFKEDLKGYYIGDHRGVSKMCSCVACVVAMVRANCLPAVHAYEQRQQKFHRYFMFQRIDRSLEIPMWFTPGCTATKEVMNAQDACHFQAGYCLSYFRKRYYVPMAKMVDGKMTTHTFLCRWKDRYTMTGMSHMSDYAAIGTRDTVATLLVGVFEHLFRDLTKFWVPEMLVAESAKAGNISVYPVNMGYERSTSTGQPNSSAPSRSTSVSLSTASNESSTNNSSSTSPELVEITLGEDEDVKNANVTCGSLAPKYLIDTCDYTNNVSAPLWRERMPKLFSRWSSAGKTCCDSMDSCIFGGKKKR